MCYKPAVRQAVESAKVRVVCYDSTKGNSISSSLNNCLEDGPSLQNETFLQERLDSITLARDINKFFTGKS